MQAFLWRGTLIGILLITIVGAVVVLIMEPNISSGLGVVGAIGSLMGAFVTTGLDITATRKKEQERNAPVSAEAAPMPAPGTAPIAAPRRSGINFGAVIKAATIGAIVTGMFGLFTQAPVVAVVCFCAEWTFYFAIGAIYAWFAHRDLPPGSRLPVGSAFMGAALAAPLAVMAGIVGNSISAFILFPGEPTGTAADTAAAFVLVMCLGLLITPVLTGIGGAATAAMLRERTA